jgi:hypothetical protein
MGTISFADSFLTMKAGADLVHFPAGKQMSGVFRRHVQLVGAEPLVEGGGVGDA